MARDANGEVWVERGGQLTALSPHRKVRFDAVRLTANHVVVRLASSDGEQAYLLLGSAPLEGRISGIVDIPNACCSLYLPTAIFDFDIRPTAEGPRTADRGQCAVTS
jgi:hypothetical protein